MLPRFNDLMVDIHCHILPEVDDGSKSWETTLAMMQQFEMWGRQARDSAQWLLDRDAVHVMATDAHDVQHHPPELSLACRALAHECGDDVVEALVEHNPRAIIAGQNLPYFSSLSIDR